MPELMIATPALLFPAISLLFLAYTNRFLHLAALIRKLHSDWSERGDTCLRRQIDNLRQRMVLIRWMQVFGALSLLACVLSMVLVLAAIHLLALLLFVTALVLMGLSLACLVREVAISGGALAILLDEMDEPRVAPRD